MWEKIRYICIKQKTTIYLIVALIALASVTPVLADYLGPNRTVTETTGSCHVFLYECKYVTAKQDYRYHLADSWACSNESKPWLAYDNTAPSCEAWSVGRTYWERAETIQQVTNTYPPATINGVLQNCTENNGWCQTSPQLSLSAAEPVSGHSIIAIEGSLNGLTFGCLNASCDIPLNEGDNAVNYWALSTWGDSSTMGTVNVKVDSQAPIIGGSLSGIPGSNGWYVSPVTFTGSASDATSGISSFNCALDNAPLGSCSPINISNEGTHSLLLTASDYAGNTDTLSQNISLDTQNPILNAGVSGTLGSNNWFNAATLNATASDPTPGSGLSNFEYNLDKTNWVSFPGSGVQALPEGKHGVDLRVIDNAGHTVSSSKTFWLDSVIPSTTVNSAGTVGSNNWYITEPVITASASDITSGIALFEYSLDKNPWTAYTTPLTLTNGTHNIFFWVQDQAGLAKQVDRTYLVDTRAPQIAGSISGILGANGWYTSEVTVSASASDPTPGSGLDTFTYILNSDPAAPYIKALSILDGQYVIQLTAQDQAGLKYSVEQNIKVDTVPPSLAVSTTLPIWNRNNLVLSGVASDNGSGLSKVDVSIDGGQSWQTTTSATSWNYDWETQNGPDGSYKMHVRVTDKAGLTAEQTMNVGVDNHAPKISLPDSWYQWNSITLDIWDNSSGISEARVEISDPEGRWPKRVIRLDPQEFPLAFRWDRRFADNTIAPLGTYEVKIIALDNVGNMAHQNAAIKILLDALPAGPIATPQPYSRVEDIPTAISTAALLPAPMETSTAVISAFGEIEPTAEVNVDVTSANVLTPHETPTQTAVWDWLESIFVPDSDSTERITEIQTSLLQPVASTATGSQSNILWGATAAAVIGATTAYVMEERRKQQEESERLAVLEAQKEENKAKIRTRKMKKLEAKWAQEKALEEARLQREQQLLVEQGNRMDAKMASLEAEDDAKWTAWQAVIQQRAKEEELQAGLAAYYAAMRQGEKEAAPAKAIWWEKTKEFLKEDIFQPLDTYVYEPIIKPAVKATGQVIGDATSRLSDTVYQPYVKPAVEKVQQAASSAVAWTNEKVYQPYLKPIVDKTIESFPAVVSWISENIYQPYIQPAVAVFDEKIYQPYLEPFLNKTKDLVVADSSWLNENIYQPYIQPVVSNFNEYVYAPLLKPMVDDIAYWSDSLWDKYGESVHGALDTFGFIPGLGDIADGLNGLVYLGEGRYLEAGISALAIIPILGDLGKAGKWGLKLGEEIVEEVVEEVAEKIVKETVQEFVEKGAQEALEEISEKILKESGEELLEKTAKEALEEVAEKTLKEVGEEIAETASKILPEHVTKEAVEELAEKVVKETGAAVSAVAIKETSDVTETIVQEAVQQVGKVTTEFIQELSDKYGKEAVDRFLPFCEKYGIDPYDVVTRPPAEGQTLMGWALGITDIKNPINHPLKSLDLTDDELKKILVESTVRPDSNIVALGYGGGVAKPYYQLSDEIKGCHLSLSADQWAPFNEARANFWADINGPFLEKSIEDRKAFLFNIKYETITDPDNIERFSLPELRVIEQLGKNYVNVPIGEYTAFIPLESLDTYWPQLTGLLK